MLGFAWAKPAFSLIKSGSQWLFNKLKFKALKREELIRAIELFQKHLDPRGENYEKSVIYFADIKSLILSHFTFLKEPLGKAEKHFNQYCYYINRIRQNAHLGEVEFPKAQSHSAFTQDFMHNLSVELTGSGIRKNIS